MENHQLSLTRDQAMQVLLGLFKREEIVKQLREINRKNLSEEAFKLYNKDIAKTLDDVMDSIEILRKEYSFHK